MRSQREMAEIVRSELQLEPIGGFPAPRRRHHGSVVDEQVEAPPIGTQPGTEILHRLKIGQIEHLEAYGRIRDALTNLHNGCLALGGVATRDDHIPAGARQSQSILVAQTACAGDDRGAAALRWNIVGRPACHGNAFHLNGIALGVKYLLH